MRIMTAHANPKVQEFLTLLQDPEVYPVFQEMVLKVLLDLEGCQLLRRVQNIEKHLGADEDYCIGEDLFQDDKEVVMTIPEQLALISERINDTSVPVLRETIFSGNSTEVRARFLKDALKEADERNAEKYFNSKEVQSFLLGREIPRLSRYIIPEDQRTTEKAARKVANDVMKKAAEMFPEELILRKNSKGLNIIAMLKKRYQSNTFIA